MADKTPILQALRHWIAQRPGLEFGNYGGMSSYRAEMRSITRDMHHARTMLDYIAWHDSITADMILDACRSGRLSIKVDGDKVALDYVTGQYWPTEYRRAVCALASSVIWSWLRDCASLGLATGDDIRKAARREFGRSIAQRWFN